MSQDTSVPVPASASASVSSSPALSGSHSRRVVVRRGVVWGTILIVCLVALVLLGGCGTPGRGTVVGRDHTDAWPEMYSYCFGTQGAQCWTAVRWWPETWLIELDDGQDHGWRTVTRSEYDACPPGAAGPDCRPTCVRGVWRRTPGCGP